MSNVHRGCVIVVEPTEDGWSVMVYAPGFTGGPFTSSGPGALAAALEEARLYIETHYPPEPVHVPGR